MFDGDGLPVTLPAGSYKQVLRTVSAGGLIGGSIYDALIAATAVHRDATLLTRDRRALPTYEALGARIELVE